MKATSKERVSTDAGIGATDANGKTRGTGVVQNFICDGYCQRSLCGNSLQ